MPASNCGLVVGSLALGVAQVGAVRQRASTANDAVHVVETIGNLLQQQSLGTDEMLTRISQYADEAVTPGAAGEYVSSLKAVVDNIESQIEAKIVHAQNATRGKLDTLFKALSDAKAAVEAAKKSAEAADKTWFECAADEQAKRQAAEAGEKSLISSRSNENEACQLQQDNKGFAFDAAGKYTMKFECDFSQGDCDAKLQAFNDGTMKKIEQGAAAAQAKDVANYNSLKTTCDTKKQERVEAQSALGSAEGAWSTKRALCKKLAAQRESSFCAFGSSAQDKCIAERQYSDLVEATQKSKGGDDSEVDRTAEWVASQTTKCLVSQSLAKGLDASITSADADACAAKVNFKSGVGGKLNTRQSEFDTLAGSFKCAVGAISFFNGQMWNVPAGDKPKSSAYTRTAFTPALNPSAGNFDFCATKAHDACSNEVEWNGNGLPFRIQFNIRVSAAWNKNSANYVLGSGYRPYMNLYSQGDMLFQFNHGGYFGYKTRLARDVEQHYEFVIINQSDYKSYVDGKEAQNTITGSNRFNQYKGSFESSDTTQWLNVVNPGKFPSQEGYTVSDLKLTVALSTASCVTTPAPTQSPWRDILRYDNPYTPTAAASGNMAGSTVFAKLSDADINRIKAHDGWNYYRFKTSDSSVTSPVYIRTRQAWSDTKPSFGFSSYEMCQKSTLTQCDWQAGIHGRFDTIKWGNNCSRWFTDYFGGAGECYPSRGPKRCLNSGNGCSNHKIIKHVVISKLVEAT